MVTKGREGKLKGLPKGDQAFGQALDGYVPVLRYRAIALLQTIDDGRRAGDAEPETGVAEHLRGASHGRFIQRAEPRQLGQPAAHVGALGIETLAL